MLCNIYLMYLLSLIFIYNKTQSFVIDYVKLLFKMNQNNSNNKVLSKLYIKSKNTNYHSSKKNDRRTDLVQSNKMKANFTTTTSISSSLSSSSSSTTTISDLNSMDINYNTNNQQRNKYHNIDNIINYLKVHMNTISSTLLINYIYELTNSNYNNNNNHDYKDKDHNYHYVSNYFNNQEFKSLVITILHRVSSQLTAYELSRLLVCMARMDVSWDKVNRIDPFMKQLLYLLSNQQQHHHHHHQQHSSPNNNNNNNNIELYIGDIVWSLGTMNARWDRFLPIERDAILQAISDNIHTMSSYSLSSTIWAMAKMGKKLCIYMLM